ncbi:hypothetical protein BCR43DRAFT_446054 [Syncephalastrum racemosum]|uniref:Nonsense-mediated mRNA decay factor SMG8 n=1 Tax=Syncephalastrum racemosum TaxID=13706 RepID=A0A1X2H317_SYNRA|nr:hypothetical protein BCR43DRAFT_446054 [Syncephalastrum racemosum]
MRSKLLFHLNTTGQPFLHIIPTAVSESWQDDTQEAVCRNYTFGNPPSISAWLNEQAMSDPLHSNAANALRNFVVHWLKTSGGRHHAGLSSARKGDAARLSTSALPNVTQFASMLVALSDILLRGPSNIGSKSAWRTSLFNRYPATKNIIQQIDAVLRKKVRSITEIERIFSKSHSTDVMHKCLEAYSQESPPCYGQQYHTWKKENVLRMYRCLTRGPCADECAARLERECDSVWNQGRRSCETLSLTGKPCRLKMGHTANSAANEAMQDRALSGAHHSSGVSIFHGCTCGKMQRLREDPFSLQEANVDFYSRFTCCMKDEERYAIDIEKTMAQEERAPVKIHEHLPQCSPVLLYLGSSSTYRNSVGLEKYEGFMNNTNYLLPWTLGMLAGSNAAKSKGKEEKQHAQQVQVTSSAQPDMTKDTNEWPLPGKGGKAKAPANEPINKAASIASLDAFPSLAASRNMPDVPATKPTPKVVEETQRKKKREGKRRDRDHRLEGLIRGYFGAEYECPQGHRFLSCGEGKVCKLGHKGHPKDHANHVVHQDLPLFALCPCNFGQSGQRLTATDVMAQLQRIYCVSPEAPVSIVMKPKIRISAGGSVIETHLGFEHDLVLPNNGVYVLRLPYIYTDGLGNPITPDVSGQDIQRAILEKDSFHVSPVG